MDDLQGAERKGWRVWLFYILATCAASPAKNEKKGTVCLTLFKVLIKSVLACEYHSAKMRSFFLSL